MNALHIIEGLLFVLFLIYVLERLVDICLTDSEQSPRVSAPDKINHYDSDKR